MRAFARSLFGIGMLASIVLAGCDAGDKASVEQPPAKKATSAAKSAAAATEAPATAEPPKYVYETANRRDPFEPLIADKPSEGAEGGVGNGLAPLQQFAVDQFRLVGVIIGKGQPAAMVLAPDGKGYVLRKGIKIGKNNGVVVAISASSVVVEEQNLDFSGATLKNSVELKLTKREGAK